MVTKIVTILLKQFIQCFYTKESPNIKELKANSQSNQCFSCLNLIIIDNLPCSNVIESGIW